MRYQLLKLSVKHSTKAERRFAERLKALHIPFKTKVLINNREIDFLVKNYAIDIDGRHLQDGFKNKMLVEAGYIPIHISNSSVEKISISYLK